jgi:hypothetical protein
MVDSFPASAIVARLRRARFFTLALTLEIVSKFFAPPGSEQFGGGIDERQTVGNFLRHFVVRFTGIFAKR